mgnify:FL=1
MKKFLGLFLAIFLVSATGLAQLKQGAWGITADITGSNSLGVAYALMSNLRLGVNLGFSTTGASGAKTTGFLIGAGGWYYLGTSENVSAFVGGGLSFNSQSVPTVTFDPITGLPTSSTQTTSTFGAAGQFGAEYWFSQKFSAHGFLQFMLTTATGAGLSIGTTTGTGLTWYF